MRAIIKEYGTSVLSCLIILILATIISSDLGREIGVLTPNIIKNEAEKSRDVLYNIPNFE